MLSVSQAHQPRGRRSSIWRIIWLVVLILLLAAGGYFYYRFRGYAAAKAVVLIQEGQAAEAELSYTTALARYESAIALQSVARPTAAQAASAAAAIYQGKGDLENAQRYAITAHQLEIANPAYTAQLGSLLLRQHKLDEAVQLADEAQGDALPVVHLRAQIAIAQGNSSEATKLLKPLVTDELKDAQVLWLYAVLTIHENADTAGDYIRRALANAGEDEALVALLQDLGQTAALLETGDVSEAYELVLVAQTLLTHQQFYPALLEAQRATEKEEGYRDAWLYRAEAERQAGQYQEATSSIDRALELDPTYGLSYYVRGLILDARADSAAAIRALEQALARSYDQPEVRTTLASWLVQAGRTADAEEALRAGISSEPSADQAVLYEALFWLYYRDGNQSRARTLATEYAKKITGPGADAFVALARVADDPDRAATLAESVLKRDGRSAVAELARGLATQDDAALIRAIDLDTQGTVTEFAQVALAR